jgi:hypothetical protein
MSKVMITPNAKNGGALITMSKKNPEYGFSILSQTATTLSPDGWIRENRRSTLLKGKVTELQRFIAAVPKLELPGRILVKEFVESEVPEQISDMFFQKGVPIEAAMAPYVKTTGPDGGNVELTLDGERILRFSMYVGNPGEEDTDVLVMHDNGEEIAAVREAVRAKKALEPASL